MAIVGLGNCASSLVQGVHYYCDASSEEKCRGCKIAKDRGIGGPVLSASYYFMKSRRFSTTTSPLVILWRSSSEAERGH